jgi:hypothetical protein
VLASRRTPHGSSSRVSGSADSELKVELGARHDLSCVLNEGEKGAVMRDEAPKPSNRSSHRQAALTSICRDFRAFAAFGEAFFECREHAIPHARATPPPPAIAEAAPIDELR